MKHLRLPMIFLALVSLSACQSQTDQAQESIKKAKEMSAVAEARAAKQMEQAQEIMNDGMNQADDALAQAKKQMADAQRQAQGAGK